MTALQLAAIDALCALAGMTRADARQHAKHCHDETCKRLVDMHTKCRKEALDLVKIELPIDDDEE